MRVYKLTDSKFQTRNGTQWGPGVTHTVAGRLEMCENGIHAYSDQLLAILLNPIHANITDPVLWECEASDEMEGDQLKSCHRSLTTLRQIDLPTITTVQHVAFGILCALSTYGDSGFAVWANDWLGGKDRSAARSVEAWSAARSAARSAEAAVRSVEAWSAARSVEARSVEARSAAAWSAEAAVRSAAARVAAIDLIDLAHKAVENY